MIQDFGDPATLMDLPDVPQSRYEQHPRPLKRYNKRQGGFSPSKIRAAGLEKSRVTEPRADWRLLPALTFLQFHQKCSLIQGKWAVFTEDRRRVCPGCTADTLLAPGAAFASLRCRGADICGETEFVGDSQGADDRKEKEVHRRVDSRRRSSAGRPAPARMSLRAGVLVLVRQPKQRPSSYQRRARSTESVLSLQAWQ